MNDLNNLRKGIEKLRKEPDFEEICLRLLKYATIPREIDAVTNSNQAVREPWVCSLLALSVY